MEYEGKKRVKGEPKILTGTTKNAVVTEMKKTPGKADLGEGEDQGMSFDHLKFNVFISQSSGDTESSSLSLRVKVITVS